MNNLEIALHNFLRIKQTRHIAAILKQSISKKRISYEEIKKIVKSDPEDILLIANEHGLLYPVQTFKSASWEDRVIFAMPGEIYEIPNIIRSLVTNAIQTGKWDIKLAINEIFKKIGEPKWAIIPKLVEKIKDDSIDYTINAQQIKGICIELGLANRVNILIAELKAAGIISPKLGSLKNIFKAHSPIYEINRSLFLIDK